MRMTNSPKFEKSLRFEKTVNVGCFLVFMLLLLPALGNAAERAWVESEEEIQLPNHELNLHFAKPSAPRSPTFLIVFASGDGGLRGDSKATFMHLAGEGHYVAAYSSRQILKGRKEAENFWSFPEAATAIETIIREAQRILALPESTPTVVAGVSRGASMVVFAAGEPSLQPKIAGAVAIALTRESDYINPPPPADRGPYIQFDDQGRILLYPALARLGSIPIAVIQSTHDEYSTAAESRGFMGPDTPTRRLYSVEARNHSFGGGQDKMLESVDRALDWIGATPQPPR
jgi:hypothetical protein